MTKGYIWKQRGQRTRAVATALIAALATGRYCGASGMPCDRAGPDCCASPAAKGASRSVPAQNANMRTI